MTRRAVLYSSERNQPLRAEIKEISNKGQRIQTIVSIFPRESQPPLFVDVKYQIIGKEPKARDMIETCR